MASTASRRKNVTTACQPCRDSKTKCDGQTPTCRQCQRKSKTCHYDHHEDKRRISYGPTLAILRGRIDALTEQLLSLGAVPSSIHEADEGTANKVLAAAGLSVLPTTDGTHLLDPHPVVLQAIGSSTQDEPVIEQSLDPETSPPLDSHSIAAPDLLDDNLSFSDLLGWDDGVSPLDWPWIGSFALDVGKIITPPASAESTTQPARVDLVIDNAQDEESETELVNEFAVRFGSLHVARDGRLRYLGGPNACLTPYNQPSQAYPRPKNMQIDGRRRLRESEIGQAVNAALERHLLELYFTWHNSCHPVVDSLAYWSEYAQSRKTDDDSICSPVLTNAMCAIGASYDSRYHADLITFPRSLADFFADRAKLLLEIDLDDASVSTVQALLLLSSHENGRSRTARSWLYSGMAMRLAFDLGLHINTDSYVERGTITEAQALTREMSFWQCYLQSSRASFNSGRPFTVDNSEIHVRRPGTRRHSHSSWRPYTSRTMPHHHHQTKPVPDLLWVINEQRLKLSEMSEPIVRALYGNKNISLQELQRLSQRTTTGLFRWKDTLDHPLQLEQTSPGPLVPQLLVLHMEYHHLQILIHRPWTSKRTQPTPAQGPGYRHARQVCLDSAGEIANILLLFEQHFGLRYIDIETSQILSSAALILVFASMSMSPPDAAGTDINFQLNNFLRALDEISSSHSSAQEHLNTLILVQERWRSMYDKQRRGKRSFNEEAVAGDCPDEKRAKSDSQRT